MNAFFDTATVLNDLVAKLEALTWSHGVPLTSEPLFQKVSLFDALDPVAALDELIIVAQGRVCLVVPDIDNFEHNYAGQVLSVKQHMDVSLIITARDWADRHRILLGDDDTLGVLQLKDYILDGMLGRLSDDYSLTIAPVSGELMALRGEVREELTGRLAYMLGLRLTGGLARIEIGRP